MSEYYSNGQQEKQPRTSNMPLILGFFGGFILVLFVVIGVLLVSRQTDVRPQETAARVADWQQETDDEEETELTDNAAPVKPDEAEQPAGQERPAEADHTAEPEKPVKPERTVPSPAPAPKPTPIPTPKPTPPPAPENVYSAYGTHNLGYARWRGVLKNRRPDGKGVMEFTRSHRLKGHQMEAGDTVDGYWQDGELVTGTWRRADGSTQTIA